MNFAPFEALLKETIGLDAASIGGSAVERVLRARIRECKSDWRAYLERLRTSSEELRQLIDAVVVPETWFFRDRGAFSTLAEQLAPVSGERTEPLRLLSIPCASGEEAYSIAIALIEAGLSPDRFAIEAVDVSPHLVELAGAAVYGKNAFRGDDSSLRNRYFAREASGYRLTETIRRCVRFRVGNLLDPSLLDHAPYDVVFCRNLLIYFDAATQDRAIRALASLVCLGGLLFVGPSEASLVLGRGFAPIKAPMAFAFRRQVAPPAAIASPTTGRKAGHALSAPCNHRSHLPNRTAEDSVAAVARTAATTPIDDGLSEIQRMADAGHMAEAARLCESHLDRAGPSADALVLLALIRDAAGSGAAAIELYRKALYLDPHHEAALAHLALRLEQAGDGAAAARLKDRMRRTNGRRAK